MRRALASILRILFEGKLKRIFYDQKTSPETVKEENAGAELVRVIRKIIQIDKRIK